MFNTLHSEWSLIMLALLLHIPYSLLWLGMTTLMERPSDVVSQTLGIVTVQAIASIIVFPFQFAQLFIADQGDGLATAMKKSWLFVMKAPFALLKVMFLTALVGVSGMACFVGIIVTLPIQLLSFALIYEDNRQAGVL